MLLKKPVTKFLMIFGALLCIPAIFWGGVLSSKQTEQNAKGNLSYDPVLSLKLDLNDDGIKNIAVQYPASNPTFNQTFDSTTYIQIPAGTVAKVTATTKNQYLFVSDWDSNLTLTKNGENCTFTASKNGYIKPSTQRQKSTITLTFDSGFSGIYFGGTNYTTSPCTITDLNCGQSYQIGYTLKMAMLIQVIQLLAQIQTHLYQL